MKKPNKFEEKKSEPQASLIREFIEFLTESKKYWLIPIIVALLIIGVVVLLGGTSVAPFIYTLF